MKEFNFETSLICPSCGKSIEDIKKDKRLGCAFCYTAFSDYVERVLRSSQGTFVHVGMAPVKSPKREKLKNAYFKLKKALKRAIKVEEYEEAHKIKEDIELIREQLSAED